MIRGMVDGLDNDGDGLIDETAATEARWMGLDNVDNDGDGLVDETLPEDVAGSGNGIPERGDGNPEVGDGVPELGDGVLELGDGVVERGDGFPEQGDGDPEQGNGIPEVDIASWDTAEWLTDGIDNDGDGATDEPGECGYHYEGQQNWLAVWDTTVLNGLYEIAVVANTGDGKSMQGFSILTVVIDHNAYDITDSIEDWTPRDGSWVGGRTRRPVEAQNPRLDPDDKEPDYPRGEVDIGVVFADGIPADLDMGIPTSSSAGYSHLNPSLRFEYKKSPYPDIGDETVHDKPSGDVHHRYWRRIYSDVVYDANSRSFYAVWETVNGTGAHATDAVANGYYDIRVRVVDEAGNVAYKVFAHRVVVDNTPPAAMITSINGDTTLTYEYGDMATDTELGRDADVIVRATAIDALTDVAFVQFQVMQDRFQAGPPQAGSGDERPLTSTDWPSGLNEWTDIGLGAIEASPENSYALHWNTSGLPEGDYRLRLKVTDAVGNKMVSSAVVVTVVDTTPPIACIAGYYPRQLQLLNWPKKYWRDTIYAVTICQADVQEVQIQYRAVGTNNWITIGVPQWIPYEQLDNLTSKGTKIGLTKQLLPVTVASDEGVIEAFDWTGLWGTTWESSMLADGAYEVRAIAKDWSGNVTPEDMAPILTIEVEGGVVDPETPGSGIDIEFTADLGGVGVGDRPWTTGTYHDEPGVVLTITASEKPTVLVLAEFDSPDGLVIGGEVVDVKAENGATGRYSAALKADEFLSKLFDGVHQVDWTWADNYLDLLRLGGRITVYASTPTCPGIGMATLTMDDLVIYPVTPELGTNGTVFSKDNVVSVNIPRAALAESYTSGSNLVIERGGLMITPTGVMPNTPKDQRLYLEPRGRAYNIDYYNLDTKFNGFREGFEPTVTMRYGDDVLPHEEPFVSVRYWEPNSGGDGGHWNDAENLINMRVNAEAKTVTFNVRGFGRHEDWGSVERHIPRSIFTIVVEKAFGRIDHVVFENSYQYPDDDDTSYLQQLNSPVYFTITDPGGVDHNNIRIYIDGQAVTREAHGWAVNHIRQVDRSSTFEFTPDIVAGTGGPGLTDVSLNLTEGFHTLKIEAWDRFDAVDESDWRMLEKTVLFYIDTTAPVVVTRAAQVDGVRYFKNIEGATASITIVDEGVGIDGQEMQNDIYVDVFQFLTENQTPLRTKDSGDVINYQRKTLILTGKPILEYCDDYTSDGVDNETWISIHDSASDVRHPAWRASHTVQVGQISDGDTFEVVFYSDKCTPTIQDNYNENAVYLYEDLTRAVIMDSAGHTYAVDLDELDDFPGLLITEAVWSQDVWHDYYSDTFLEDRLLNEDDDEEWFVRQIVADTRAPAVTLNVPEDVRADALAATISASATDDNSGIETASLVINGEVMAEKAGPMTSVSLSHTLSPADAVDASEIVVMAVDRAGNETVVRRVLGVQETDGPVISGMTPEGEGVADATPTIAATYSDDSAIDVDSVVLTLNGAVITTATVGVASVSYTPVAPLEAGVTYTVKLTVADEAGSVSEAIWTFALETDAPEITDTAPSSVDETGTPLISAKFADAGVGVDVGTVRLVVDGNAVAAAVTDSSVSFRPADVMESGAHSATLSVADVAGNVAELTWEFNVEDTAPSVTDVEPAGTINEDMPVLSGSYADSGTGIDVDTVQLSLNGEVVQAEVTPTQVSFGVQEPLRPGVTYTVSVTVSDRAGNVGSASSTFQLEDRGPTISSNSPTGTVQSVDVAVSANYSDSGSGIDQSTALMKVDGVAVAATPSASGISYQATGLLAGDHTVYVEVADRFGNVGSRSWSFKVEEDPPTISAVEPDGEVNEATPTISASYGDAGSGIDVSSVVLKLGGQILPAVATETGVSYKVLTALELGVTYKVEVEVADKAGNVASDGSTFSLETDPPEISSTKPSGTVSEEDAAAGILISAKLADDGSGVDPDSVVMWVNGEAVAADASTESVQYTANGLNYGDYNVRLVVADMLGNSTDESWSFSVDDSTPPTVTVVSPKHDSVVGVRPVIKISYADEGSGVDLTSISVKVDEEAVVATAMAPAKPARSNVVSAGEASYEVKLGFGSHTLTVVVKDVAGNEATAEVTFIVEGDVLLLVKPHNYPNPFRGSDTKITFGLSQESDITIRIYDFTATLVATVVEDERTQADEKVEFSWDGTTDAGDGHQLANGIYFCQILSKTDSERKSEIVKIALVRE